ncbi:hypothetical protein AAC387_Pa02g5084 [Persea americana]
MYSEELAKRLSSELSGNLKKAALLWIHDPAGRNATIVRNALSGDIIDLKDATEVICPRYKYLNKHTIQGSVFTLRMTSTIKLLVITKSCCLHM